MFLLQELCSQAKVQKHPITPSKLNKENTAHSRTTKESQALPHMITYVGGRSRDPTQT